MKSIEKNATDEKYTVTLPTKYVAPAKKTMLAFAFFALVSAIFFYFAPHFKYQQNTQTRNFFERAAIEFLGKHRIQNIRTASFAIEYPERQNILRKLFQNGGYTLLNSRFGESSFLPTHFFSFTFANRQTNIETLRFLPDGTVFDYSGIRESIITNDSTNTNSFQDTAKAFITQRFPFFSKIKLNDVQFDSAYTFSFICSDTIEKYSAYVSVIIDARGVYLTDAHYILPVHDYIGNTIYDNLRNYCYYALLSIFILALLIIVIAITRQYSTNELSISHLFKGLAISSLTYLAFEILERFAGTTFLANQSIGTFIFSSLGRIIFPAFALGSFFAAHKKNSIVKVPFSRNVMLTICSTSILIGIVGIFASVDNWFNIFFLDTIEFQKAFARNLPITAYIEMIWSASIALTCIFIVYERIAKHISIKTMLIFCFFALMLLSINVSSNPAEAAIIFSHLALFFAIVCILIKLFLHKYPTIYFNVVACLITFFQVRTFYISAGNEYYWIQAIICASIAIVFVVMNSYIHMPHNIIISQTKTANGNSDIQK